MIVLSKEQVAAELARARTLAGAGGIVDVHVHATEVIEGAGGYDYDAVAGVYTHGGRAFASPALTALRLHDEPGVVDGVPDATKNRLSAAMFRQAYTATGPAVLRAHMELAGVRAALLLPVARPTHAVGDQMDVLRKCRDAGVGLHLAYCVPAGVAVDDVPAALEAAVADFGICAVKLHPNLSDIDLGTRAGRARAEAILRASARLELPVIVHGGRSPILGDAPAAEHALLAKLDTIDWTASGARVVIAHLGVYGCRAGELAEHGARLSAMLARHERLMTDTSGLDHGVLAALLGRIDLDRVLFGSDALYTPMWKSVVTLLRALEAAGRDSAVWFPALASGNARRLGLAP